MKKFLYFLIIFISLSLNTFAIDWKSFAYELATSSGSISKYENLGDGTLKKYIFSFSPNAYMLWDTPYTYNIGDIYKGWGLVIRITLKGSSVNVEVREIRTSISIITDSQLDSDGDGCPDIYDLAPNDPSFSNCQIDIGSDCEIDSDGDGVPDCRDPAPYDPTYPKQGDLDFDGFPDELDPYINDNSDFKYKEIAILKNLETGEKVGFEIQTDRGDIFSYNMDAEGENLLKFLDVGADRKPFDKSSDDLKEELKNFSGNFVNGQIVNPTVPVEINDYSQYDTPVSNVSSDNSGNFFEIESSQPPENLGDVATSFDIYNVEKAVKENSNINKQGLTYVEKAVKENSNIIRESGKNISSNVKGVKSSVDRIADKLDFYLSEKNNSSPGENFDVDTTDLETKLDDIINQDLQYQDFVKDKFEDFENISGEKISDFENLSVEDYYNSEKFSGELIEGEDFDSIIPLSDQTFIQDFFSNNPVLSALSSSKIEIQNSKCDFTLVTSLGIHEMDLCFLESGFNKAGVILLSLTTLFSLFVVVKK